MRLCSSDLKREMESSIIAAQDQVLNARYHQRNIMTQPNDSKCRMCYKAQHIKHIVAGRTTLAPSEYTNRHNRVDGYINWMICKHIRLQVTDRYYEHIPEKGLLWYCGALWGLTPKVVHWFYVSIIRPLIGHNPGLLLAFLLDIIP